MVWAVGIGLVCMALWRLSEAVFGAGPPAPAHTPPRIRPRAYAPAPRTDVHRKALFPRVPGAGTIGRCRP
ncbi:hypothetical protein [Streptomyces sp. 5-10]|uniref:hypothetical protein n=1 Tax=Streptomyces sp. 5-10 TaxID=878925 RepID=UPI00351AA031